MSKLLIKNGRVIDPATGRDGIADVLIDGGRQRLMLLPMLFGMYFVNTCAVTMGLLDALLDLARGRAPEWDKTKRMNEASA